MVRLAVHCVLYNVLNISSYIQVTFLTLPVVSFKISSTSHHNLQAIFLLL